MAFYLLIVAPTNKDAPTERSYWGNLVEDKCRFIGFYGM